jgi:hypothetical protein
MCGCISSFEGWSRVGRGDLSARRSGRANSGISMDDRQYLDEAGDGALVGLRAAWFDSSN